MNINAHECIIKFCIPSPLVRGFPVCTSDRVFLPMQETQETRVQSLGWEDPLEKEMATHSSIFAWKSPWTEESGGLQSIG